MMMNLLPALAVTVVRRMRRPARRARVVLKYAAVVAVLCIAEALLHAHRHRIPRPAEDLDAPFARRCLDPRVAAAQPRESAALVMLARNSEMDEARETVRNIEAQFNQWFHYPVVFLNNEPWDPEFVRQLNASVSGRAVFDVIPEKDWSYPAWIDPDEARQSMARQAQAGVWNGGKETYHHMCRFYSGAFYDQPALRSFKWYWRLEPGVRYTCAITYDPFAEMARHGKAYGYTVALWEEPNTCPSLFRAVDDFRAAQRIPAGPAWEAMLETPLDRWYLAAWPIRALLGLARAPHHAASGARWNLCHYWSNFEIASLDFFRSPRYRALFAHLDRRGGFFHERWGDAPVHSLAAHLLLAPAELHHFSDLGYHHEPFFQCPGNAPGGQLEGSEALRTAVAGAPGSWAPESDGAVGCRCTCGGADGRWRRNHRGLCLERLQRPAAVWRMGWADWWRGRVPYAIGIPK